MKLFTLRHSAPIFVAVAIGLFSTPAPAQQKSAADLDRDAKDAIFNSEEWRKARDGFTEWLSIQQKYTPEQVAQIKAAFDKQVSAMTAPQLRAYLDEMNTKLAIMLGPEAQEARNYIANYMSLSSAKRRAELRKKLPDFGSMTPAQMDQALNELLIQIRGRKTAAAQQQQFQQQRVAQNQQALQQAQASQERALQRAVSSGNQSSRTGFVPQRAQMPTYGGPGWAGGGLRWGIW